MPLPVTVALEAEEVPLGAPVWVAVTVANPGPDPVPFGADAWPILRPDGTEAARPLSAGWGSGGAPPGGIAEPGVAATYRFDAAHAGRIDAAGAWRVTVTPWVAYQPADPVTLTVRVVEPMDPAAVIAANPVGRRGDSTWLVVTGAVTTLPTRWDALGDARFVPLLEADLRADPGDARAWGGLAACPCPEATDAWLRLHAAADAPGRAEILATLAERANHLTAAVTRAPPLSPAQRETLRAVGWAAIADPSGRRLVGFLGPDPARVGEALTALDAALADPLLRGPLRRNAVTSLLRTVPPGTPAPAEASAPLRALLAVHALRPDTPADVADAARVAALGSGDPDVVAVAARRAPSPMSEAVALALIPHLDADLGGLQLWKPPDTPAVRAALVADLAAAPPAAQEARLEAFARLAPAREVVDLIVAGLAADPPLAPRTANVLAAVGVATCARSGRSRDVPAEEMPSLVAAWRRALASGATVPVPPGPGARGLAPSSVHCTADVGAAPP
jgi:hypothetical protein